MAMTVMIVSTTVIATTTSTPFLQVKCEKYWPEENEAVFHGDLVVQVRSQSVLPDYIIRVIDVKMVGALPC